MNTLPPASLAERFWKHVAVRGPNDCWLWTGSPQSRYGKVASVGGRGGPCVLAHRVSWILHFGDPGDKNVCHTCDTPKGRHWNQKKTHCPSGHLLSGKNLYVLANGRRRCKVCRCGNPR